MRSRSLLLASLLLLVPGSVSAQALFRAPLVGLSRAGVSASAHHTVADATADGGTIAAIHFDSDVMIGGQRVRSVDGSRTVAIARLDPEGRVFWIRRLSEEARGAAHLRVVSRLDVLRDGGAIVGGSFGDGGMDQGALMRLDSQGRTRWTLHPTRTSDYSRFVPVVDEARGRVVVLGNFFRGRFALPGVEGWRSAARFTSFLAEVDLADGRVRWARTLRGEGRQLEVAPDGTIVVTGQFQRRLRIGASTLVAEGDRDVYVARYAADGEPTDAVAYGTSAEDHPRGVALRPDGGFGLLVSSTVGGSDRYALLGFAPDGTRTFRQPVGPRAMLVRSDAPGPVVLALPGATRTVNVRGRSYDAISHVELVRFSAHGARVSRRPVRFAGRVGLIVRSLHVRSSGGRVVLSGALSTGRGSESFHVWLDAPAAPRAVPATYGAVL